MASSKKNERQTTKAVTQEITFEDIAGKEIELYGAVDSGSRTDSSGSYMHVKLDGTDYYIQLKT
jgi:hypothetical protein